MDEERDGCVWVGGAGCGLTGLELADHEAYIASLGRGGGIVEKGEDGEHLEHCLQGEHIDVWDEVK